MAKGWIKLYRQSEDNPLYFAEPFDKWHAWQDLLLLVDSKEHDAFTRFGAVHLMPGQGIFGEEQLAKRWKWSRNKVRRYFSLLSAQKMAQIDGTAYGTVITIVNWAKYQSAVPSDGTTNEIANGTTDGTTDGTLTRIYKNSKEGEKGTPQHYLSDEEALAFLKKREEAIKNAKTEEERIRAEYGIGF